MRAKKVNVCSPEDGSQKDETGCGRAAEDRFPDQVASKPCFVVLKNEYEDKNLRRSPSRQSQCQGLPANIKLGTDLLGATGVDDDYFQAPGEKWVE